jgi:glycosyltransferase involved in cell wall biosynthesis
VNQKPLLAIASPFLDKRHGTERIVVEWITQLAGDFEIHVYSQQVEDLDLSQIAWHRIPKLPGPHLFNFLWWFAANQLCRAWDQRFRHRSYDIVFSPGINCLDADAVSVHIVFAEYYWKAQSDLQFGKHPIPAWPRLLHRKLYYHLLMSLERRLYSRLNIPLILMSHKTANDLERFYGRRNNLPLLYLGLDHGTYNPARRTALRERARRELDLSEDRFVLLLVGNDWRNKGVLVLLDALEQLRGLPVDLLLVSREDSAPVRAMARERGLGERVRILPPRKDVEFYYAAADAYAGPSLGDTFALPPAEAMACGLPVIVSSSMGASEIMTHGVNGLILDDPRDGAALAGMIRQLYEDGDLAASLGERAAETARQYTWERNGRELAGIFENIARQKARPRAQAVAQDS